MLRSLHLKDVGPAPELKFEFAPRLNVLTGDNGLGKTFVLDVIWFVLTNSWSSERAFPFRPRPNGTGGTSVTPELLVRFAGRTPGTTSEKTERFVYERAAQLWSRAAVNGGTGKAVKAKGGGPGEAGARPGRLVIYARADGGISVWDALRAPARVAESGSAAVQLSPSELWLGKSEGDRRLCRGLVDDWVFWRNENGPAWKYLLRVLDAVSPPDEPLVPGEPVPLRLDEDRLIPTLDLPYGVVPVTLASAGMKRILGIAYAIVWAWTRHVQATEGSQATPDLVLLIDEVEAHLHPTWQRLILPAILKGVGTIAPNLGIQAFVATHAPLVLASIESSFDEDIDDLFHFRLDGTVVSAQGLPFAKQGDAGDWLVSESFGLRLPRSIESQRAIEAALAFMENDHARAAELLAQLQVPARRRDSKQTQQDSIDAALKEHVPSHDEFWPTWIVTAGLPSTRRKRGKR